MPVATKKKKTVAKKKSATAAKRRVPAKKKKTAAKKEPVLKPSQKIHYKEDGEEEAEVMSQKDFFAQRAEDLEVEDKWVRESFKAITEGKEFSPGTDWDEADVEIFGEAYAALEADWEAHQELKKEFEAAKEEAAKEKEAEKERKAKEKEEAEKRKAKLQKVFTEEGGNETSLTLGNMDVKAKAPEFVQKALGRRFKVDKESGDITILKAATDDDIAKGLAHLNQHIGTAGELRENFCLAQAKLCISVEKAGKSWKDFFSEQADVLRVGKYIRTTEIASDNLLENVPMNNLRPLIEARYSSDKEENAKIKEEVLKEAEALLEEEGEIKQSTAKELAKKHKVTDKAKKKAESESKFTVGYICVDEDGKMFPFGTESFNPVYAKAAEIVIAIDKGKLYVVNQDQTTEPLAPADDKVVEWIKSLEEEAPEEEEELNEDVEDELEEEVQSTEDEEEEEVVAEDEEEEEEYEEEEEEYEYDEEEDEDLPE